MIIKSHTETGYTLERENGEIILFTNEEMRNLKIQLEHEQLLASIRYTVKDLNNDMIRLDSLNGITEDEFIGEVFESLRSYAEYDEPFPSESYIEEVVLDTADSYGIRE